MIVEKFARDHPAHFDAVNGLKRMPVVVVQMVSGPDEARFYKRLLAAIGAPEPTRPTLGALESVALRVLEQAQPGMLVIDEVHSLQAGTVREQARFLNMLRFLGNELRIRSCASARSWPAIRCGPTSSSCAASRPSRFLNGGATRISRVDRKFAAHSAVAPGKRDRRAGAQKHPRDDWRRHGCDLLVDDAGGRCGDRERRGTDHGIRFEDAKTTSSLLGEAV